jgi:hypothetical protein
LINASNITDNDMHFYNVTSHGGNYFDDVFTLNDTSVPMFDMTTLANQTYVCEGSALPQIIFNVNDVDWDIPESTISPQNPFYIRLYNNVNTTTNQYEVYSGILSKANAGGVNGRSKTYNETISVMDEVNTNITTINITVIEINNAPAVESIGTQTIVEGGGFYHAVLINDTENGNQSSGNLTLNISFMDSNGNFTALTNISRTGVINFTTNASIRGDYTVSVCAIDKGLRNPHENISLCGQNTSSINQTTCTSFLLRITETPSDDGGNTGGGSGGGGGGSTGGKDTGEKGHGNADGEGDEGGQVDIIFEYENDTINRGISCTNWTECRAKYGLTDILENKVFFKGEQTRECTNIKTKEVIIQNRSCNTKVKVTLKRSNDCFQDSLQVLDENNELISRLQFEGGIKKKLNIQFILDKGAYCPYCYNSIKDYDETSVDCGGSCAPCYEKAKSYGEIWKFVLFFGLVFVLILLNTVVLLVVKYFMLKSELKMLERKLGG